MGPRLRKAISIGSAGILLLALVASATGIATVRRSFPQTEGQLRLPGLLDEVDVYRDSFGVPHIYASSHHDLFLAQGFVHAQDRFWQMDFWRHIGSGRLAELFGESQVETDRFLRTLGWERIAREELRTMDPESLTALEDYAQGVNAYLERRSGAEISLEYALLGLLNADYAPEAWEPANSLTWTKVMAWNLGGNLEAEIDRALLLGSLSQEELLELYPTYPSDHPTIIPDQPFSASSSTISLDESLTSVAGAPALAETAHRVANINRLTGAASEGLGSNDWVIAGDRTVTGMPILADDTHLGIQLPSIWYEVGLHCRPVSPECRLNVTGFSFAGLPGVVIGHNDRIAWGVTNTGPDVQDLYLEKINPANPDQYEVNGEWVDVTIIEEVIEVAGGDPIPLTVRQTRHGPIISDTFGPLEDFEQEAGIELPAEFAISLRWTGLEPASTFSSAYRINLAADWEEFRAALRDWDVPSQNFVYADVEGNIGYQMPGKIPLRASGDGWMISPGWTDEFEWTGYVPFEELPYAFNPPQGYIATANNAVIGAAEAPFIARDWDHGYRAARIVELIESTPRLSLEDVQAIQADNYFAMAPVLMPVLGGLSFDEARLSDYVEMLRSWDHQNAMDSPEAALMNALWRNLLLATFGDEFPDGPVPGGSRAFLVMTRLIDQSDSGWWDDVNTTEIEERDTVFRRAFQEAVREVESAMGERPSAWNWGTLHSATFRNSAFGESGITPIEALFNRGPFQTSGGTSIVNATGWSEVDGYEVQTLPSQRLIVDLSDLNRSLSIHTTGQSGHAFHPHYIDMVDLWREVQFHPMLWDFEEVANRAEAKLTLTP